MSFKTLAKSAINLLPREVASRILTAKNRFIFRFMDSKEHSKYFEERNTRKPFLVALAKMLDNTKNTTNTKHTIIEFGCSGGNNLALMREIVSHPISYCGLDINPTAIAFAKQHFSNDTFYVCSDAQLPKLVSQLGHFDAFIMSAVLCYLDREAATRVLLCAAEIANYVLVCDDLRHFDLSTTGESDGHFLHPYASLCRDLGLEILMPPTLMHPDGLFSYFIAGSIQQLLESP